MEDRLSPPSLQPRLQFEVPAEHVHLFTTVLQSGIEVMTESGNDIGSFLCDLAGFTPEYLSSAVETIFLNGTPVDDLGHQLQGENTTLALSAAMPGLAGAIFRKNSFHSPLRTTTAGDSSQATSSGSTTVTLKLFNTIAKERGRDLLHKGVITSGIKLAKFLERNARLVELILTARLNETQLDRSEVLPSVHDLGSIYLIINEKK